MTDLTARERERYRQAVRDLNNPSFWRQWLRDRQLAAPRAMLSAAGDGHDR